MMMIAAGVLKTPALLLLFLLNDISVIGSPVDSLEPRDNFEETLKTSENTKRSAKYEFGYAVRDGVGGQQGHLESREGEYGLGLYYVNLPNSETSVQYFTDGLGYHPLVQYSSQGPPGASTKTQFALGKEAVLALKNTAQKLSAGVDVKTGRTLAAAAAAAVAAANIQLNTTEKPEISEDTPSTIDTLISLNETDNVDNFSSLDDVELKAAPSSYKIKYGVKLKSVIIRENESNNEKVQIKSTTPSYIPLKPIIVADLESGETPASPEPTAVTNTDLTEEVEESTPKSVEISSSYSAAASPSDHLISPPPPAPPTYATVIITPRPNQPILTPSVVQAQAALALVPPTQQTEKQEKAIKYNTIVEVHKSIPIELDNFHLTIEHNPSSNKAEDGLNGIPVEYIQQLVDEGERQIQEQLKKRKLNNNLDNKSIFSPQAISNNNNNNLSEENIQKINLEVPSELSQAVPVEYSSSTGDYVRVNTIQQIEQAYQSKVKQHLSEPIQIISPVRIEQIETQSQKEEKLLKQEEEDIQDVQKVEEESQKIEVIHRINPNEEVNEGTSNQIAETNPQSIQVIQQLVPQAQVQILVPHSQYNYNSGPEALPLILQPREFSHQQNHTSQNLQTIEENSKETNQYHSIDISRPVEQVAFQNFQTNYENIPNNVEVLQHQKIQHHQRPQNQRQQPKTRQSIKNKNNEESRPILIVEEQPLPQDYANLKQNYGNHQPVYDRPFSDIQSQKLYAQDVAEEQRLAQTAFQQQRLIAKDIELQIQQQQQHFDEQQNQLQGLLDIPQPVPQNQQQFEEQQNQIQGVLDVSKPDEQAPYQNIQQIHDENVQKNVQVFQQQIQQSQGQQNQRQLIDDSRQVEQVIFQNLQTNEGNIQNNLQVLQQQIQQNQEQQNQRHSIDVPRPVEQVVFQNLQANDGNIPNNQQVLQHQIQQNQDQQNLRHSIDVTRPVEQVAFQNLQTNDGNILNNQQVLQHQIQQNQPQKPNPTQFQTAQQEQQQQNDPRKIISSQTLKAAREGYRKDPSEKEKQIENKYNAQLGEELKQDQANFARLLAVADFQIQKNEGLLPPYEFQLTLDQPNQQVQINPSSIRNHQEQNQHIQIIQDQVHIQPVEGNINAQSAQQLTKINPNQGQINYHIQPEENINAPIAQQLTQINPDQGKINFQGLSDLQVNDQTLVSESHHPAQIYIAPSALESQIIEQNNENIYQQNEQTNLNSILPSTQLTKIIEKPVPVKVTKVIEVTKEVKVPHPVPVEVTKLIPVDRPVPYSEPYPHPIAIPIAVPHPVEVPHYIPYPQLVPVPYKEIHPIYIQSKAPSQLQEPPPRKYQLQFPQNHAQSLVRPWFHEGARYGVPSSYFQPPPLSSKHHFHQGAHLSPRLKGAASVNSGVVVRPPRHHKPKALNIEYGFKPPLRPSTQIHDESLMIQDKSDKE